MGFLDPATDSLINPMELPLMHLTMSMSADTLNNRIQKFTANGIYSTQWGSLGTGNGEFNATIGIDVNTNGNVYVVDRYNHRIQEFALINRLPILVQPH